MDEGAKRRAAARRQRILENANNRLEKITGIENKSCSPSIVPETELVTDELNGPIHNHCANVASTEVKENETLLRQREGKKIEITLPIQPRIFVIIGLAIFTNLQLVVLSHFIGNNNLNKIFLPFLIYKIFELFNSSGSGNDRSVMNPILSLFLMQSAQNPNLKLLIKIMSFTSFVLQDLMLYFFVFVISEMGKQVIFTYF